MRVIFIQCVIYSTLEYLCLINRLSYKLNESLIRCEKYNMIKLGISLRTVQMLAFFNHHFLQKIANLW
jgi:hypothetical protein